MITHSALTVICYHDLMLSVWHQPQLSSLYKSFLNDAVDWVSREHPPCKNRAVFFVRLECFGRRFSCDNTVKYCGDEERHINFIIYDLDDVLFLTQLAELFI